MEERTPKLYPAWRQAEADLIAQGVTYGSLITDDWLRAAFGITEPTTIAQAQRNDLVMLRQTECLRESLLETRKMMLRRVQGVGCTVVPPDQQTKLAMEDRTREVKNALRKLAREISHVDHSKLNDAQRKENTDAQAKLGALRGLVRKRLANDEPDIN
jgi:hypothetical protein